ncbi:MAG: acyl-CoA thioesterase [Gammaproteobacteria bacterium]|nr:acyl-CoA thioesterase [Gammaproteobacteria bacterium]
MNAKESPYIHWRTISFGDTDAAGIVYTTRYTDYCMDASEFWFREYLDCDWYEININQGMGTPVVHMELDFTASLVGSDKLAVVVRVAKIGRSTVTLEYEGLRKKSDNNDLVPVFTAKFIHCFYSKELDSAIPIPKKQFTLLKEYTVGQKS